jgi:hypothetical protein
MSKVINPEGAGKAIRRCNLQIFSIAFSQPASVRQYFLHFSVKSVLYKVVYAKIVGMRLIHFWRAASKHRKSYLVTHAGTDIQRS